MKTENNINEVWDIAKLTNWKDNPKTVEPEDFERLKRQIQELGVYKPIIITSEGIVLGGNSRLRALLELGETKVWVNVVSAPTQAKMLEYALSDNDASGQWENGKVVELLSSLNLDPLALSDYQIDAGFLLSLPPIELPRTEDHFQTDDTRDGYENAEKGQVVLFADNDQKTEIELFIEQTMEAHEFKKREDVLLLILEAYEDNPT